MAILIYLFAYSKISLISGYASIDWFVFLIMSHIFLHHFRSSNFLLSVRPCHIAFLSEWFLFFSLKNIELCCGMHLRNLGSAQFFFLIFTFKYC